MSAAKDSYRWYLDAELVRDFLTALIDASYFNDVEEVRDILERPQRYNELFNVWEELAYPTENDESWEDFVNAVTPDSES
jgi:hypothetical protein